MTASAMKRMPATSIRGRAVARTRRSMAIAATIASTAIGTFIQNAQRQPMVLGEPAAEQRPGDRGEDEDAAGEGHVAAPLPRRDDVGDDRLREDHQSAAAEALDGAPEMSMAMAPASPPTHAARP